MKIVRPVVVDDAALVADNVPETDYSAWAIGTTYAEGDRVRVVATDIHKVYESAVGANVGHDPLADDGSHWIFVGATNRWTMFDGKVGTQTLNADSIDVTLRVPGRVDTAALLNVTAASARLIMTDDDEGVVYDQTQTLTSDSGITDGFAYTFEPIIRNNFVLFDDLPPYSNAQVEIILADAGNTVGCGECIVGQSRDLGGTQWGPEAGITDFSVKEQDSFGNWVIVPRGYSDYGNFNIWADTTQVDAVKALLAGYRATPILYIGDPGFGSTMIYGFFKDFRISITYPTQSLLTLELEGL